MEKKRFFLRVWIVPAPAGGRKMTIALNFCSFSFWEYQVKGKTRAGDEKVDWPETFTR